ncbi:DNA primase [Wenyingzhuangia fucanilytica]|uniref:DNA primase n=1 Tax=Wenyingzhuangia fucanilytica TaxID=1790137 RepID=A0A1B1Y9D2_9FLAO|nr:DNA primase [Wenyingzhuangia fucanilytica]ANW97382.1 DNA primase [Wenyingzhuangia fucanilytica]
MISRETIDRVFETARVEEVIGEFVTLKKSGSSFKGLSPFVDEKSPSFMVSPVKGIWKDFSTGKGGNAISFLMEHEHYSYPEAIRYLANKYNIVIEETEQSDEQKEAADERESMYLVSKYAQDYFHKTMLNTQKGKAIGLSYFKERGFTQEMIETFQLGYCLDEWTAFTDSALKDGYDLQYLESTGVTIVKEGGKQFDRFKGRVMFPIHSMSGRVLGFGGRILTNDKKAAKYLNSPESEIYHKSKILYGIYQAKKTISKEDNCYLVEGYTDVISMYQSGITNVVASSGTALTPDQIRLVKRLTPNMTVLFDGDAAGLRASVRGIDLILEQGMNVKVVTFPDGDDPDSFAKKKTTAELKEYLESNQQDFISFKVSLLMEEAQNDPIKKAGLIRDIVMSISKIPDSIKQEVYIQECSRMMDISETVLFNELAQMLDKKAREVERKPASAPRMRVASSSNKEKTAQQSQSGNDMPDDAAFNEMMMAQEGQKPTSSNKNISNQPATPKGINTLDLYEREIIQILLLYGNHEVNFIDWVEDHDKHGKVIMVKEEYTNTVAHELYLQLQDDEIEFTNPLFLRIYKEISYQINQEEKLAVERLTSHEDSEIASEVTNILMDDERYVLSDWASKEIEVAQKTDVLQKLVQDAILNLRRVLIELKVKELMQDVADEENRIEALQEVMNYTQLKALLFDKLHRVL